MNWADSAGVSYLAWGWIVETRSEQNSDRCSAFVLINNYTHYTPARPNGIAVYDHLRALASGKKPPVTLKAFSASTGSGGKSADFRLRTAAHCTGTVTGKTVHSYPAGKGKAHKVAIGVAHFALKAGKAKTVVLELSKAARRLLIRKHALTVTITISLSSPHHLHGVSHHTITLKAS
jgi:hypothetical protein